MGLEATPRPDLPRGTVTMLFADVEGSTRLLHSLGERFAPARARLREVVRMLASVHGGHEVDWAGDGVFLVFRGAREAVEAAVEIQRALDREPWPADEALRLRVGLHTGEPERVDEGYIGMDVVVTARICAAAHGGQVVVSRTTRDMAGPEPVREGAYSPLGRHRLKDVPRVAQLFQVVAPGLGTEFPPLRTLRATSLPALHHRLVGREVALERIRELFARPEVRLVTITGPGGAGKSRLALEATAGAALERPVHLVGLAPVSNPELVPDAIARALGLREAPGRTALEIVAEALDGTGALLYLDNLEHLPPAAVYVAELLDLAPDVDVLVTSRAPLRLLGEHVLPLDPLLANDAVILFVELAAARGVVLQPEALPAAHEICRRLDGLPLAIELVAARLVVLSPPEIVRALDEGLALEMEGPIDLPERQRTLRAAIDWSYGLLTESQRDLHGALAVFPNGCTLDDARAVAGGGPGFIRDLEALVAWSLARSDVGDGGVRLSLLETVREHALERLHAEGALDGIERRHAERFLELALSAEIELEGPDQALRLERIERELENFLAAFDRLLALGRVADALRLASALGRFWRAHGHVNAARRLLERGLADADGVPDDVRAGALSTAARQAAAQSDLEAEVASLEEALVLYRKLDRPGDVAQTLAQLGWIALQRGDETRAVSLCEEALAVARTTDDPRVTSAALNHIADVYSSREEHAQALAAHEEALALRRELGDPLLVVDSTYNLGIAAFESGDVDRARAAFEESLALAGELGDVLHRAAAWFMLAELDLLSGDVGGAEAGILRSLAVYAEVESDRDQAECLVVLGGIAIAKGSLDEAARLFGAAEALRGASPVNRFERPVLERFEPALAAGLDPAALAARTAEGQRLGGRIVPRVVVVAGSSE